jgi:peptidase E
VSASRPTIVATSIGFDGDDVALHPGPAYAEALRLAQPGGRRARVCIVATAVGDDSTWLMKFYAAFAELDAELSHLALFPRPNHDDPRAHLLRQDVIWVAGGSTVNLLALWRAHGLDTVFHDCWQAGIVLMGVSAGSVCWHAGGTTDSYGLRLRPVTDALAFLPYSNSPHHDAEKQRRPLFHDLIAQGVLPDGYATDNGAGLVYVGTELHDVICDRSGALGYEVTRRPDGTAHEQPLTTRLLG